MINIITYTSIALLAFCLPYFWLQKLHIKKMSTNKKNAINSYFSKMFFTLTSLFVILCHFIISNVDQITPLSFYQLMFPIIGLALVIFFPKFITTTLTCLVITYFTPQEVVTNYLPQINIYLNKLIVFAFIITFSTLFERQNTAKGMPFINISAFGLLLFIMFLTQITSKSLGLTGLFFASTSYAIYLFTKFPTRIETSFADNKFFALFTSWIILLSAAEYGLLPSIGVFAIFFTNLVFQLFQKIKNYNFKKNFDIYNLAINEEEIDENDLYSYAIKSYFIMILLSIASAKSTKFDSTLIMYAIFSSWFLYKTYNLYQKKSSLKSVFKEIKEKVGGKTNDKSS